MKDDANMKKMKENAASLRFYNYLVAAVHSTSFVALLIISIVNYSDSRLSRQLYLEAPERTAGTYRLFYTLLPFPFITALFHIVAASGAFNYYKDVLVRGVNPLRWLEYTITNGLMTFSIAARVGYTNITNLLLLLFANAIMQACGYAHEFANQQRRRVTLFYLLLGFVPWFYKWTLTLLALHTQPASVNIFAYDYVAVYGALAFSLLFVAPLVYKYYSRSNAETTNYNVELTYLFLSLSAKLWLDWTITIGNLVH